MKRKDRIVLKTAGAMLVLLLFFFAQGAIVVITGIEGIPSALIRGAVIWGLVIITLAYSIIRYKGISKLGFRGMEKGAVKRVLYFVPLLLIALSPFAAGVDLKGGAAFLFANLFLTLGIQTSVCSHCGESYHWKDSAVEIIGYSVEYLQNYYTPDEVIEHDPFDVIQVEG